MAKHVFRKSGALAALAAGLALVATPASAQDRRGGWRERAEAGGGEARGWNGGGHGGGHGWARQQQQAAPPAPQAAQQPMAPQVPQFRQSPRVERQAPAAPQQTDGGWRGRGQGRWNGGQQGGWQQGGQAPADRQGWRQRQQAPEAQAPTPAPAPTRQEWQGRNRGYADQGRDRSYGGDARREHRDGEAWRGTSRNWSRDGSARDGGYRDGGYRDGGYRDGSTRYGGNDRYRDGYRDGHRQWDRRWRDSGRYDWHGYRNSHRHVFRMSPYYAPYRGYYYQRLGIGFYLDSLFFGSRYWISDPWSYRLPDVYGPYRWVRYYDDVLLVDIYSGEVVDVIYNFFW